MRDFKDPTPPAKAEGHYHRLRLSTCPECGRLIYWVKSITGLLPLDSKPQPGLYEVSEGKAIEVKAHTNHLATCPRRQP